MAIVVILRDYNALFDTRETPGIAKQKELAVKQLSASYFRNVDKDISIKDVSGLRTYLLDET